MSEEKVKKPSVVNKKIALSQELAKFMGAPEASRPEVVKELWVYIKAKSLQDPANKRMIRPDAVLAPLLGATPLDMMALPKALSKHYPKKAS